MEQILFPRYSVLMSVYEKENPQFLRESVESMIRQTVKPDEVVLVVDGPVFNNIKETVVNLEKEYGLKVVYLSENKGLGNALNHGLEYCSNEIVARMDSDDISFKDRIEKELTLMLSENADIVSGTVLEFVGNTDNVIASRKLPQTHSEILKWVRKRNPFNHPAVIFKKNTITSLGGYSDYLFFEDYELFANALSKGAKGANVDEPCLFMRAGKDMYKRRGGINYVKHMLRFYKRFSQLGFCSFKERIFCVFPRIIVALMPNYFRKNLYKKFLRGQGKGFEFDKENS